MSQNTILSDKNFRVDEDSSGNRYIVVPDGAGVIAMNDAGQILLTREFRPKLNRIIWRIPAGKADPGEDLLACARRELREESGYDANDLQLFFDYQVSTSDVKTRRGIFIAHDLFVSPLETGDEVIKPEVHFLAPASVLALLNDGEITGDVAAALYRFLHVYKLI